MSWVFAIIEMKYRVLVAELVALYIFHSQQVHLIRHNCYRCLKVGRLVDTASIHVVWLNLHFDKYTKCLKGYEYSCSCVHVTSRRNARNSHPTRGNVAILPLRQAISRKLFLCFLHQVWQMTADSVCGSVKSFIRRVSTVTRDRVPGCPFL